MPALIAIKNIRTWLRIALILAIAGMVVLTHIPADFLPPYQLTLGDKIVHALGYGVLMALWWTAGLRPLWGGMLCLILLAGLDEWTQTPFNRQADILDWLADVMGILLVFLLAMVFQYFRRSPAVPASAIDDSVQT